MLSLVINKGKKFKILELSNVNQKGQSDENNYMKVKVC